MAGLVFIPDQVDVYSDMKIHYDDSYASFSIPGKEVEHKSVEETIAELEEEKKELKSELEQIRDRLSEIENKLEELRDKQNKG